MSKSKLIFLFYFVLLVLCGLLFSNALMLLMFWLKGIGLNSLFQDGVEALDLLSAKELLVMQLCSQVFSMILPAWIYLKIDQELASRLKVEAFKLDLFLLSLAFFLLSIPLVGYAAYCNQLIPLPEWMVQSEDRVKQFIEKLLVFKSFSDLILSFIVIAVIPAIAEEWVFRGIIQNYLIRWLRNPWIAVILSSIIFSGIHMQFEGFLPRFLLGFSLGFVYLTGKNLWYPILLHLFNNGSQILVAYFNQDELQKQLSGEMNKPETSLILISTLLCVLNGWFLFRKSNTTL